MPSASAISSSFFSVEYEDLAVTMACERCLCCTPCRKECGCEAVQDETENELVLRVLGCDSLDSQVLDAQEVRERMVEEEKDLNAAKCGISKDMEENEQQYSEDESEGDQEEAVYEEGEGDD